MYCKQMRSWTSLIKIKEVTGRDDYKESCKIISVEIVATEQEAVTGFHFTGSRISSLLLVILWDLLEKQRRKLTV